jgi:histidinol dehydrogenase
MIERMGATAADAAAVADQVRGLVPEGAHVTEIVAGILAAVREGGDRALLEHERRYGGGTAPVAVPADELAAALAALDPAVRAGLEVARENIDRVAVAGLEEDRDVPLPQGHSVRLRQVPVHRVAVYAPGGRHPYPSTVLMGVLTARAAGVREVVVAAPGHPVILAAAALCGADEVLRMGGAQAVAALTYGTETIRPVDVIVGPGSLYVQEAKRIVSGTVGIDGFAGPSDLTVLAADGADPRLVALDLLAQAEHGEDSLVVAVSHESALLDEIGRRMAALYHDRGSVEQATMVLIQTDALDSSLAVCEALAPEHLQLCGAEAEALAPRVTRAGALFVGNASATAFGDYVAGSNHTLPTAGAARFASGLTVRHFRRTMTEVRIGGGAAGALAGAGAPIAEAEGFPVHAESMTARMEDDPRT